MCPYGKNTGLKLGLIQHICNGLEMSQMGSLYETGNVPERGQLINACTI